jgi:mono/diheme cytochrome c family protein
MNFHRVNWSIIGRGILGLALVAVGALLGKAYADTYPVVTVPLYGVGLAAGQPAAPVADDQPAWAKRLEEKIDRLLERTKDLDDDKPPPAAGPVAAKSANHLQAAAEVCAKCHGFDTFKTDGDGFAMFTEAGAFREFQDREVRKIVKQVTDGTMPPPKKAQLTRDERAALLEAFSPKK